MCEHTETFTGTKDIYGGIELKFTGAHNVDEKTFVEKLENSLDKWTRDRVKSAWFVISLECSRYIPILTERKFTFHHTSTDGRAVSLVRWLRSDIPNLIPYYAHTFVGVGGIVINEEKHQVLVVTEKIRPQHWKFPGGYVDPQEGLDIAVRREILEETGIETEFESVIVFRHTPDRQFNCSDLYFVAKLKPLSFSIVKCDNELERCEWMDIDAFLNNSSVLEMTKDFLKTYLECKNYGVRLEKREYVHEIFKKPYSLYSLNRVQANDQT